MRARSCPTCHSPGMFLNRQCTDPWHQGFPAVKEGNEIDQAMRAAQSRLSPDVEAAPEISVIVELPLARTGWADGARTRVLLFDGKEPQMLTSVFGVRLELTPGEPTTVQLLLAHDYEGNPILYTGTPTPLGVRRMTNGEKKWVKVGLIDLRWWHD